MKTEAKQNVTYKTKLQSYTSTKQHRNCHTSSNVHRFEFKSLTSTTAKMYIKVKRVINQSYYSEYRHFSKMATKVNNKIYWTHSCHVQLPNISSY